MGQQGSTDLVTVDYCDVEYYKIVHAHCFSINYPAFHSVSCTRYLVASIPTYREDLTQ